MWNTYQGLYFTTCTILKWIPLLSNNRYKEIIIDSFRFLVYERSIDIIAFVIMPDHIHVIWQLHDQIDLSKIKLRFLKYTAQKIKWDLTKKDPKLLELFHVNKADRKYQIWQRNSLSFEILTDRTLQQKIIYIHHNPCNGKWKCVDFPEDYKYSSASYFHNDIKNWDFLC